MTFAAGILHLLKLLEMHVSNTGMKTIVLVKAGCDIGMDVRLCLFFGQILTDLTDVLWVVHCYLCCLVYVK